MKFKIKEAREKANLTQTELAARIGVAPNTFCGYENGLHDPKPKLLVKIAAECGTTVDFLLGLDETKKSPAPEDAGEGRISLDTSTRALVAMGLIREGDQLSDDDLAFIGHIMGLLNAWFAEKDKQRS